MEPRIIIKETSKEDLLNIMSLWNNGEVMSFVGYPQGLGMTLPKLIDWLPWVISKPNRCHYSIYQDEIGYCGETFYHVDEIYQTAALDIKLLPEAQGKGIAEFALRFAIEQAFFQGKAKRVYVDPHPDNIKAWNLYRKLGFTSKARPEHLEQWDTYLEITREDWENQRPNDGTYITPYSS
ncbi:MAG: GNAT family N-acetyltransferase [Chloroflexi bacterium HGW-Chloroflexi-2]|jgi:RimJ/RimL family protein N-acetyltransferase|nr:MAG: GNAT family N-acetyltransferase [Chloroflexi bacterium HGW-Chloroflexi-2]